MKMRIRISNLSFDLEIEKEMTADELKQECQRVKGYFYDFGPNYISPDDYKNIFGVTDVGLVPPRPNNIIEIWEAACPFTPGKKVRETHILAFAPSKIGETPGSINVFRALANSKMAHTMYGGGWIAAETFANEVPSAGEYILIPKEILKGSYSTKFPAQQTFFVEQQKETPALTNYSIASNSRAATMALAMYFLKNGERCWPLYSRFNQTASDGQPVVVGYFDAAGLDVSYYCAGANGNIGLALSRNL